MSLTSDNIVEKIAMLKMHTPISVSFTEAINFPQYSAQENPIDGALVGCSHRVTSRTWLYFFQHYFMRGERKWQPSMQFP